MKKIAGLIVAILLLMLYGMAGAEDTDSKYKEIYGCGSGFVYCDDMLSVNQNDLSTDLAKASMVLARGTYSHETSSMLQKMGYDTSDHNYSDDEGLMDDEVAYTIGCRDVPGTNKRIICVVIRGTHGVSEWISNFKFATNNGIHKGFSDAADEVDKSLAAYISGRKEIIFWFTGHSRGAAVANILAAKYSGQFKTFGYTYACPAVCTNPSDSYNIWNFNNTRDLVPKLPPSSMNFYRNGHDYGLYWASTITQEYEDKINTVIENSGDYEDPLNRFRLSCIGLILSGSTDVSISDLIQASGDVSELAEVEDLSNVNSLEEFENAILLRYNQYSEDVQYIKELKALAENMTDEDFEIYMSEHPDINDRIYSIPRKKIEKKADIAVALVHAVEFAESVATSETSLQLVFELAKEGKHILDEIKAAHDYDRYMNHINKLYFGYGAEKNGVTERIALPDNITTIGQECFCNSSLSFISGLDHIKAIGSDAFAGCGGISDLVIPNSVEYIGEYAFSGCTGLLSVTMPIELSGLPRRFENCDHVETIHYTVSGTGIMPERTDYVSYEDGEGNYLLMLEAYAWSSLQHVILDEGVQNISSYAFGKSNRQPGGYGQGTNGNLFTIEIPATVKTIGMYAFAHRTGFSEISIPAGLTEIGEYAFHESGITSIVIPEGVTIIPDYCFDGCYSLESANIPSQTTSIGDCAFNGCTLLSSDLIIPNSVEYIGEYAFSGCTGLLSVTMPIELSGLPRRFENCDHVETIHYTVSGTGIMPERTDYVSYEDGEGNYLLMLEAYAWSSLQHVILDEGVQNISSYAFGKSNRQPGGYGQGTNGNLFTIEIPATVKTIGMYAFAHRTGFSEISIPAGLTEIGEYAFHESGITSIVIPEGVTIIPDYCFDGCYSLESANIPSQTTSIGDCAFNGCTLLSSDLIIPNSVTSIGEKAFYACSGLVLIDLNTVESIGIDAFGYCYNLTHIYVRSFNDIVHNQAGFQNTNTIFHCYKDSPTERWASQKGFSIEYLRFNILNLPDNTRIIENESFSGMPNIDGIRIPNGVTSIATDAFDADVTLFVHSGSTWAEWARNLGIKVVEE